MQNYAKVGGILSIIAGGWGILWAIVMIIGVSILAIFPVTSFEPEPPRQFWAVMVIFYGVFGGFFVLAGILAIIGGVYALKRRIWGLALAGSIGATVTFFPCGIPAIIFTALAKPEFAPGDVTPPQTAG